jgi:hypothetical protein
VLWVRSWSELAIDLRASKMVLLGHCIYTLKQSEDQRPSVWISQAGAPTVAAVVAAPIRKLCDEYTVGSCPAFVSNLLKITVRLDLVKQVPDWNTKTGVSLGALVRKVMYFLNAVTGHVLVLVAVRVRVWPFRNGSVLDSEIWTSRESWTPKHPISIVWNQWWHPVWS